MEFLPSKIKEHKEKTARGAMGTQVNRSIDKSSLYLQMERGRWEKEIFDVEEGEIGVTEKGAVPGRKRMDTCR